MFRSSKEGWQKGQIVRKFGTRTYLIRSSLGVLYKRNRVHIRPHRTLTRDVVPNPSSHTSVVARQSAPPAVNDTVAPARPPRFRRPPGDYELICATCNPNRVPKTP